MHLTKYDSTEPVPTVYSNRTLCINCSNLSSLHTPFTTHVYQVRARVLVSAKTRLRARTFMILPALIETIATDPDKIAGNRKIIKDTAR